MEVLHTHRASIHSLLKIQRCLQLILIYQYNSLLIILPCEIDYPTLRMVDPMDGYACLRICKRKEPGFGCKIDTAIGVSSGMLVICIESLLKWQFCIRICSS